MQEPIGVVLCGALPASICVASHYFPWRYFFRRGRLPRLLAYAIGLLSILLPATIAMLFAASVVAAAWLLWLAAASAGLGTLACWWYDWHNRSELQRQDEADRESMYAE